jgi:glycosyltransferase involved in cell wall biosynthesis
LRFLGIAVANGFSSEVRVMATLLGEAPAIDAAVVVNTYDGGPEVAPRVRELSGADVHALDLGWRPRVVGGWLERGRRLSAVLGRLVISFPRLLRIARAHRPDVVYSSQQKWDARVASLVAAVLRRPYVMHLHYIPGPWLGRHTMRRLRRGRVVCVSNFIRDLAIAAGAAPDRVVAVLNPVGAFSQSAMERRSATRDALGVAGDEIAIGFIGRLSPWKGQRETVQAFARLGDGRRARLILVGDGEIRDELGELATTLGVADRTTFTGLRNDIPELLAAFDVFAHPSYDDPCPLAVLEAQAAGLPVVAFAEGGIREIVADGTTGLLAPDRDVDELAERLARLVDDAELRARMGTAARERATTVFDPARAGNEFARAIEALR